MTFSPFLIAGLVKTPVVTTIHGFSSPKILPVYQFYNQNNYYVSIQQFWSKPGIGYLATVYHGIDLDLFTFNDIPGVSALFRADSPGTKELWGDTNCQTVWNEVDYGWYHNRMNPTHSQVVPTLTKIISYMWVRWDLIEEMSCYEEPMPCCTHLFRWALWLKRSGIHGLRNPGNPHLIGFHARSY